MISSYSEPRLLGNVGSKNIPILGKLPTNPGNRDTDTGFKVSRAMMPPVSLALADDLSAKVTQNLGLNLAASVGHIYAFRQGHIRGRASVCTTGSGPARAGAVKTWAARLATAGRWRDWTHLVRTNRATFRSMGQRNFRLFFLGQLVSACGIWVHRVALLWLILQLTGSSLAVGVVTALNFAPVFILSPWGGLIADRHDKRRLLLVTQSLRAVPAILLALLAFGGAIQIWMVYAIAFVLGVVTAIDSPTRRAFVRELVGQNLAANAVSLNTTVMTTARISGPAIAGVLITAGGTSWCFAFDALTYIALLTALRAMSPQELHRMPPTGKARGQLYAGLRYAACRPEIRRPLLMLAAVSTFAWGALEVIIPLLARFTFNGGAETYGLLFAVMSLGALGGALFTAGQRFVGIRYAATSSVLLGVLLMATAFAPTLLITGGLLFGIGAAGASFLASENAVILLETGAAYQGRVLAFYSSLVLGGKSFGGIAVAAVSDAVSPRGALVLGSVVALTAGLSVLRVERSGTSARCEVK